MEDISMRQCSALTKPGNGSKNNSDSAFWLESKEMYNVYGGFVGYFLAENSPLGTRLRPASDLGMGGLPRSGGKCHF